MSLNNILSSFQGYWLGGINTKSYWVQTNTFSDYILDNDNLGVRWIIADLENSTGVNGGSIGANQNILFQNDITYSGNLEIDVNSTPNISLSATNIVYLNIQLTFIETIQNVYDIILVWNELTRTIQNISII